MLGSSASSLDAQIRQLVQCVRPAEVLELGCGRGKFGQLLHSELPASRIKAVQKLFSANDLDHLRALGYGAVIDKDILEYYREGFDESYNLIVALDVIEHFLYSDVLSIINFSLYRADYMLLVWPSAHPQFAVTSPFDRHRASFELRNLADLFDVVFYAQTGFAQLHFVHRYHVALIRGFMNAANLPPLPFGT
jgi:hypothetical protein